MFEQKCEFGAAVRYSELRISVRVALGVLYEVLLLAREKGQKCRIDIEDLAEVHVPYGYSAYEYIRKIEELQMGVRAVIDKNDIVVFGLDHFLHGDLNLVIECYEGHSNVLASIRNSILATVVNIPLKIAVLIGYLDLELGTMLAALEGFEMQIALGWLSTLWGLPRYVYLMCNERNRAT